MCTRICLRPQQTITTYGDVIIVAPNGTCGLCAYEHAHPGPADQATSMYYTQWWCVDPSYTNVWVTLSLLCQLCYMLMCCVVWWSPAAIATVRAPYGQWNIGDDNKFGLLWNLNDDICLCGEASMSEMHRFHLKCIRYISYHLQCMQLSLMVRVVYVIERSY